MARRHVNPGERCRDRHRRHGEDVEARERIVYPCNARVAPLRDVSPRNRPPMQQHGLQSGIDVRMGDVTACKLAHALADGTVEDLVPGHGRIQLEQRFCQGFDDRTFALEHTCRFTARRLDLGIDMPVAD